MANVLSPTAAQPPVPRLGAVTLGTCTSGHGHVGNVLSPTAAQNRLPSPAGQRGWQPDCCFTAGPVAVRSLVGHPPPETHVRVPGCGGLLRLPHSRCADPAAAVAPLACLCSTRQMRDDADVQAPRERRPLCRARRRSATAQSTATGQQDRPQSCNALRAAALVPGGRELGVQEGLPGCLVRGGDRCQAQQVLHILGRARRGHGQPLPGGSFSLSTSENSPRENCRPLDTGPRGVTLCSIHHRGVAGKTTEVRPPWSQPANGLPTLQCGTFSLGCLGF